MKPQATLSCPQCATLNRADLTRVQDRPKCGKCGRPLPLDRPIAVGEGDLDRVLGGTTVPVLVDFYADWCGPCKTMAPVLDAVARARQGDVVIAKLDTDRHPGMSTRFGIRGIPTLILFHGGKEVAREVGAVPRQRLEAMLDRTVQPPPGA